MSAHDSQTLTHDSRGGFQTRGFRVLVHNLGFHPLQLLKNTATLLAEALCLIGTLNVVCLECHLRKRSFTLINVHRSKGTEDVVALLTIIENKVGCTRS